MALTNDIAPYVAPKHAIVSLPGNIGDLEVTPASGDIIDVNTGYLLVGSNLYQFHARMKKVGDCWYFLNKAEIGVTGGRPSPKRTAQVLDTIAATLNTALASNQEFQQQLAKIQQQQEAERLRMERDDLRRGYKYARRRVESALIDVANRRGYLQDSQESYERAVRELEVLEAEHPELKEELDIS